MSRELGLHSQPWTFRPHFAHGAERAESAPPVLLIEVPAVAPLVRQARRPSRAATERVRIWGVMDPPRRRRRLRREVRLAGYALLALTSLSTAGILLQGGPDTSVPRSENAVRPPAISLSIEPAAVLRPGGTVVLPGYLLPADVSEEPSHAGG
ncbi:MAG: hypothetical protein AB7I30_09845 [Isosphaeraceae bacterium]